MIYEFYLYIIYSVHIYIYIYIQYIYIYTYRRYSGCLRVIKHLSNASNNSITSHKNSGRPSYSVQSHNKLNLGLVSAYSYMMTPGEAQIALQSQFGKRLNR